MARILIIVSNIEFDPSEACIPWKVLTGAGHDVRFASGNGEMAQCDPVTLTGVGLPKHLQSLAAKPESREIYVQMAASDAFQNPMAWSAVNADDFDALVLPGGHAPGVKPYLESEAVFDICRNFFARKAPVSSVCHGVLALARAKREDGKSVLHGYSVTGLNNFQEKIAIKMTRKAMGGHYQTYPETVQDEVSAVLAQASDFKSGPTLPAYGSASAPH
ncbi:MAG: type 1 glutamine amidotransferase domain-containing protein, partial [Robiginitomaculum sp.]